MDPWALYLPARNSLRPNSILPEIMTYAIANIRHPSVYTVCQIPGDLQFANFTFLHHELDMTVGVKKARDDRHAMQVDLCIGLNPVRFSCQPRHGNDLPILDNQADLRIIIAAIGHIHNPRLTSFTGPFQKSSFSSPFIYQMGCVGVWSSNSPDFEKFPSELEIPDHGTWQSKEKQELAKNILVTRTHLISSEGFREIEQPGLSRVILAYACGQGQ